MSDPNQSLAAFTPSAPATQQPAQQSQVRKLTDNVSVTGLDDQSVRQYEFDYFKGEAGVGYQIWIPRPMQLVKGRTHFHDKLKRSVLCQSVYGLNPAGTQEQLIQEASCCKFLGTSQQRFAMPIVRYGTDRQGNVIVQQFSYETMLWLFGTDKFKLLQQINRNFPLDKHDLQIACTDAKFQKMTIIAMQGSIVWDPRFPPAVRDGIFAWADSTIPKLAREIGRTLSDGDLRAELQAAGILTGAVNPGPAPNMMASDAPMANFDSIINITPQVQTDPAT